MNYSKAPYVNSPGSVISYAECHDNNTLWDKLAISTPGTTVAERTNMHKLALSIVLTSQGISFLHAGTEFLRSKKDVENSYNKPDSINAIDWNLKTINNDVFNYVQQLISLRKEHPAFRMQTAVQIQRNLSFLPSPRGIIGYRLNGSALNDIWKDIQVWFNGNATDQTLPPEWTAGYKTAVLNNEFVATASGGQQVIKGYSCIILYRD